MNGRPELDLRALLDELGQAAPDWERAWHTLAGEARELRAIDAEAARLVQLAAGELELALTGLHGAERALRELAQEKPAA